MVTQSEVKCHCPLRVVVLATMLLIAAIFIPSSAGASAKVHYPPPCRDSQIKPSISLPKTPYSAKSDFTMRVWFLNQGSTCEFPGSELSFKAVRGPGHVLVAGSPIATVLVSGFSLEQGRKAGATFSVGSIRTNQYRNAVKKYGVSCKPVLANGVALMTYPDIPWPTAYFPLGRWVQVCTGSYLNLAGSFPHKVLTTTETKQQAVAYATTTLKNFLDVWKSNGQVVALKRFVVPSQRVGDVKLLTGQVLDSNVSNIVYWRSPRDFSILVALDLHFSDTHRTWRQGINERIVNFSQSGSSPQLMSFEVPSLPSPPTSTNSGG